MANLSYLFKASLFVLAHYSAIGALGLLSYLIGQRLTRRFTYHSWLEQVSFSVSLGLGVIAYLVFFLGLLGWLYSWVLLIALGVCALLCRPERSDWLRLGANCRGLLKRLRQSNYLLLAIAIVAAMIILAPFVVLPLYPPLAYDGVMYHLPYAKIYVAEHGIVSTPYLRFPVAPQTSEMLFTLALSVYDDILAHLTQLLQLVTLALAVAALGRRYFSPLSGCWASVILLANPLMIWLGTCAYVDVGLTLFINMAVYAFWNWLDEKALRWLILAGVFSGVAVGTKLSALFIPALIGAVLLYLSLKERKLTPLLVFNLIWLLVAAPWLARSFYYTRNPVFPFFQNWFSYWFGAEAPNIIPSKTSLSSLSEHWTVERLRQLRRAIRRLIITNTLPPIFYGYIIALPLIFLGSVWDKRLRRLLGFIVVYFLYWGCTVPDVRYVLPLLPVLSVATAAALDISLRYFFSRWASGWRARVEKPVWAAAMCVIFITPSWLYAARSYPGRFPVTSEQRDTFLTNNMPSYPAYKFLNGQRGKSYTVYALMDSSMTYYADGHFIVALFGPSGFRRVFDSDSIGNKLVDGQTLYRRLKELDVNYFVVDVKNAAAILPEDNFFKERFKLIYEQPGLMLFELTTPSPSGARSH
ncbi:MAG: phospholipid carrier-dependent glycosyltransferase [Blastocatellales bacterium]